MTDVPAGLPRLAAGDFDDFLFEAHGHRPFAWQRELLARVLEERSWPSLIDLPTGAGKTSVIDIGLFALALDASSRPDERWAPRRIALVVDRRIVVDQVAAHVTDILDGEGDVLDATRSHLRWLSGSSPNEPAFVHGLLRGAMVRDERWAERPDVPAVLASTVDQIGSRLLFRGYGLSNLAAPIHAGLLGSDLLLFLDEVHLSRPFSETLARLRELTGADARERRWQLVELTATPNAVVERRFPAEPLTADTTSEPLRSRLVASKPAQLVTAEVPQSKDWTKSDVAFAKAVVKEARAALDQARVQLLGVVLNRVDTARSVAHELAESGLDVTLLTGRMRPADRDSEEIASQLAAWSGERDRLSGAKQVLVSTQCIEAGADLDLDCLVTELASIDALRQRFGRVDRRGHVAAEGPPPRSVVVVRGEHPDESDPIYGGALVGTWSLLRSRAVEGVFDFGVEAFRQYDISRSELKAAVREPDRAPFLDEIHLEAFAQTSPRPTPDHVAARWLHGHREPVLDVTIVWRDDLDEKLIRQALDDDVARRGIVARLKVCRPVSTEGVAVPIAAARAWLAHGAPVPVADVEIQAPASDASLGLADRPAVRWSPDGQIAVVGAEGIRPGDVVVVPGGYGGIAGRNWDPSSTARVSDVAMSQHARVRQRAVLRLTPGVWSGATVVTPADLDADPDRSAIDLVTEFLDSVDTQSLDLIEAQVVEHLRSSARRRRLRVERALGSDRRREPGGHGDEGIDSDEGVKTTEREWFVLSSLDPFKAEGAQDVSGASDVDTGTDADEASFTGVVSLLHEHVEGVGALAARFAERVGLPRVIQEDLRLAGELHDLGKADSRFQLWLCGADPVEASRHQRPLAKSPGVGSDNWADRNAARRLSRYPDRARHELQSLALARSAPEILARAHDRQLVEYLVASHHGHCRPFAPAFDDGEPVVVEYDHGSVTLVASSDHGLARLGSGIDTLFWDLGERYGWHRLAYLEAVFRLADHRRSAEERSHA